MISQQDQEIMQEDWLDILRRPGMNVLATFLMTQIARSQSELEDTAKASSYDKVCEVRGELRGLRMVKKYVKQEYDRAAKGDTPEKEK